jgi:phytoene dehydrogenase-like protein
LNHSTPHLIVGAGAAGCAAAKCFAAAGLARDVVWLEQHNEPGGCAGYFSRGAPRRSYDAGATQLIECAPGSLQEQLYSLAPAENQTPAEQLFEKIPTITQHWPDRKIAVVLKSDGKVDWQAQRSPTPEEQKELAVLETFLGHCCNEAAWMWSLLSDIPRFPPQSFEDIRRALMLFLKVPLQKKILFPFLFLANARTFMNFHRVRRDGLANDVLSGLLIDTTQSSPEKSPWLAAAMGMSILSRGIYRCRKGMRAYFRPSVSAFEERGGTYNPSQSVIKIETTPEGFLVTSFNRKTQSTTKYLVTDSALLNLTVWDVVSGLVPQEDPLRTTRTYRVWEKRAKREHGWGAFALYAVLRDQEAWPAEPHFHQIFPEADETPELQSSLYVSIPARNDPANPPGYRVMTATLHLESLELSQAQRQLYATLLSKRISAALGVELEQLETAFPRTFEHFTARRGGQVGGYRLTLRNFLFFATPSMLTHPSKKNAKLLLMGDTVFPGQGVVACSVSGIIAFERATNLTFRSLLSKQFGAKNQF